MKVGLNDHPQIVVCNACNAKIEGESDIIASQIYVPEKGSDSYLYWNFCRAHMTKFTESIVTFSQQEKVEAKADGTYATALSHFGAH